jgi:hypothetical protein
VLEQVEEGADEEEEPEEPISLPGSGKVGISDRDEFRPSSTC